MWLNLYYNLNTKSMYRIPKLFLISTNLFYKCNIYDIFVHLKVSNKASLYFIQIINLFSVTLFLDKTYKI